MKILILTDHLTHSDTNSFYLIANSLYNNDSISEVHICSRSQKENEGFFDGEQHLFRSKQLDSNIDYASFDNWIRNQPPVREDISYFDYILLRLPRPIHPSFFDFLVKIFDEKKIINRPSGIKKIGNKAFLTEISRFTAPVKLLRDINDIEQFRGKFPVVLKPLEEYGGKGIIKIENDLVYIGNDRQLSFPEFKNLYRSQPQQYLGMKFLRNVKNGDKRIVVANRRILAATLRFPAADSWLCNVAQGGSAALSGITEEEKDMISFLDPIMIKEGIFMYGLDTLENDQGQRVISEINVLSVGGLAPSAELSGQNLGDTYAELFVNFVKRIG
ncbi:ATP-grasp domain-containing protein [Portibacter marinus]|uniref:ATP-grasp domain-containing protein n=1 Tax=Portibacter marinus TaxID=2898660 RepID=UPI001F3A7A1D|nr:glutathione synthetase [Portibacter marinus]